MAAFEYALIGIVIAILIFVCRRCVCVGSVSYQGDMAPPQPIIVSVLGSSPYENTILPISQHSPSMRDEYQDAALASQQAWQQLQLQLRHQPQPQPQPRSGNQLRTAVVSTLPSEQEEEEQLPVYKRNPDPDTEVRREEDHQVVIVVDPETAETEAPPPLYTLPPTS